MARGRQTARDLAADSAYARADRYEQPTDLAILAYIPPKPNAEHKASLNQQEIPLSPHSTIPPSQHTRSASFRPCTRHTPISETTLPPPT